MLIGLLPCIHDLSCAKLRVTTHICSRDGDGEEVEDDFVTVYLVCLDWEQHVLTTRSSFQSTLDTAPNAFRLHDRLLSPSDYEYHH